MGFPTSWRRLSKLYGPNGGNAQIWVSPVQHFGSAFGKLDDTYETLTIRANADGDYNVLVVGTRKDEAAVAFWDAKGTEYQDAERLAGASAEPLAEAEQSVPADAPATADAG